MIIDILEKSEAPMQTLGISFKINEIAGRIINLNAVKNHLETLVEKKKLVKSISKDEIVFYGLKK
jgi:repressor of nif and glnA expression